MSLEETIKENTKAINKLSKQLEKMMSGEVIPFPETKEEETKPKPEKKQKREVINDLSYEKDVQPAAFMFIEAKGESELVNLLTNNFGVKRAPLLEENQWPEFIKKVKAELG